MDPSANKVTSLRKLCEAVLPNSDAAYEIVQSVPPGTTNETQTTQRTCEKIHTRLSEVSAQDADKFKSLYPKINNSIPTTSAVPSSSKSTAETASCSSHAPKQQDSNQSLPSASNNMGIALQYNDRGNTRRTCVQEAILAATGISRDASSWPRPVQYLFSRIAHLGVLHNRLREFIDPSSGLMPEGLMTSGLETAIRDELTEYYRDIAIWDTEAKDGGSTLRRVAVWAQEPLHRLRWLVDITHAARHKKGGKLASCVHFFLHHGDERVVTIARSVLNMIVKPLLHMIYVWLTEGVIYDPFSEFFIETIDGVPIDRMWHDKYRVRESMLPSFISGEQAAQILVTGKSVAFMRAACGNDPTLDEQLVRHLVRLHNLLEPPKAYVSSGGSADEMWWKADWLRESVSKAHASVSVRLLDALSKHHHLLDHLAAHRRYLLLAQGDFVDYLLTLVQEKLERPAKFLYWGDLKCSLDVALEATTAQFEPPQVLDRIDVELYRGEGEYNGWDVFALKYRVDGPLGALFPAACVASYRALFVQLWRVKRVEFTLHRAWSDHAFLQKKLKAMPEVAGLMLRVSCLRAAALQLMGALQSASCESAEAEWAELLAAAAARAHLDRLLALHQRALDRHSILAMLHHTTEELRAYLENVLNDNLALRSFEMSLHDGIIKELDRRDQHKQLKAERLSRGESIESGANAAQDDDMKNRKIFAEFLSNKKADLDVWARTYGDHVTTLILKLSTHPEASFQALASRLDYNDFYKRDNAELQEPLTYRYKRLSLMGHTSAQE